MNMLTTAWRNQRLWLDKFFAGYWFWLFRLWFADRHMATVLERYGDQSMEARRAMEVCSRVHFAVQFGRMAPSWERCAVRKAKRAGHNVDDIRMVMRNRDFIEASGWLTVRQTGWLPVAWTWVFPVVACIQWTQLCLETTALSVDAWVKIMVIAIFTMFYWVIWRGVSLYTTRPLVAGIRLAKAFETDPVATESGKVLQLQPRSIG